MKIFAPLHAKEDVCTLIDAGIDEFFCGVVFKQWDERFGDEIELNRRSKEKQKCNFPSIEELDEAIKLTHQFNKKLFLTLNQNQYTSQQLPYIKELIGEFKRINGDGIIVADPNAMELGKEKGFKVVISTVWSAYNSEAVKFFKKMGADRIILSRDISLEDIKKIREEVRDIEIEVFMKNASCKFSESMCLPIHSPKVDIFCRFTRVCNYFYKRYDRKTMDFDEEHKLQLNNFYYQRYLFLRACGICAIWRLLQCNIDACKVPDRYLSVDVIKKDIELVKKNIEIATNCKSEKEYLENMYNPFVYNDKCRWGFQCYYPEIYTEYWKTALER